MEPIVKELASRGHQVTVVSNFPQKIELQNYTDIPVDPFDHWAVLGTDSSNSAYDITDVSAKDLLDVVIKMGLATTENGLQTEGVKKLVHAGSEVKFDIIIVEAFFQEAFLMFAHKFKCPVVAVTSCILPFSMNEALGNISPWSHVPYDYSDSDDNMNFRQRLTNIMDIMYDKIIRRFKYWPKMQAIAEKHFSHLEGPLPDVRDLMSNISVLLTNSHVSLNRPRPLLPGIVEVGGLHIRPAKPLPQDIQKLLDNSENGAIYFSMGSNLKGNDLPAKARNALFKALGRLPVLVLWKWEGNQEELGEDIPKNVVVRPWWPQSDVLAHPKVRLFITHGGLLSVQESVHRGVPMLGLPIYGDQKLNSMRATRGGYGLTIPFNELSEERVEYSVSQLLNDPMYSENAKSLSAIFRDRVRDPLETAIYWIEYVLRHKGAKHLRSAAIDMSWSSYYMLDIIGVTMLALAVPYYITKMVHRIVKKGSNK
ncbi:UDP-glucuronosyltransferase 2B4-like [Ctenocephalides felis]|uniref:UDP-glucuronosyltransferase 2B4-like n=1 Tax=Ctenocephalides felis TaxID=7515 RepID=UPI000E6E3983|nr:UDP-glucuronosyltransferase 2B4-like [Ctenocephalides felis]